MPANNNVDLSDSQSVTSHHTGFMSDYAPKSVMGRSNQNERNHPSNVAKREQKAVFWSKIMVILVLVIAVVALATATYFITEEQEQQEFETQFQNYASEVIAISQDNVKNMMAFVESFALAMGSSALESDSTWPNVTIQNYGARATAVRNIAQAQHVALLVVVEEDEREGFEAYAKDHLKPHIQESLDYQGSDVNITELPIREDISYVNITTRERFHEDGPGPYVVNWHRHPFLTDPTKIFNMNNQLRVKTLKSAILQSNQTRRASLSYFQGVTGIKSQLVQPIFEDHINGQGKMVGMVWMVLEWGNYFKNLLPENAQGLVLVIQSKCGFDVTYEINGLDVKFVGFDDLHDPKWSHLEVMEDYFRLESDENVVLPDDVCLDELTLHLYPSDIMREDYETNNAILYTCGVLLIFAFTTLVFCIYDYSVKRRQRKVMDRIVRQDRIVSNLFPAKFRDKLYGVSSSNNSDDDSLSHRSTSQRQLHIDIAGAGIEIEDVLESSPLADLYLETTVMFADISGFTSWSSAREPSQVFTLLECIYGSFDRIANRIGVFKVETVGDCYVAAAGLPEARDDHALAMAHFARACLHKMTQLTEKLEMVLGPDTGDLKLRVGLNSGQVTAGVLRGERARFQLFGDTVNTASRMESTCKSDKIQLSDATAALLLEKHGKAEWVSPREDRIPVHGKGNMQTYWLESKRESSLKARPSNSKVSFGDDSGLLRGGSPERSLDTGFTESSDSPYEGLDEELDALDTKLTKKERLVEWNVEILCQLLVQILAARKTTKSQNLHHVERMLGKGDTVIEEFKEIITLPKVELEDIQKRKDPNSIDLDPEVVSQLRDYITAVAGMYRENDFHNFEHASHVTASVRKLLTRIVSYDNVGQHGDNLLDIGLVDLVGHSYGITSSPLTQFAVVFSAIIHDAAHPGVPNVQLVKEKVDIAQRYEKSVAEQNSVDLCWSLLMQPNYSDLRACIYSNEDECRRFRQLVVNTVMATDIADKELQALRKARWVVAFDENHVDDTRDKGVNRKATIVIEHLIQASDVSHTMQHWHVYRKWNERFFNECYKAYKEGRADTDPSLGWYKGEIGFFDFYIIPLAKKLDNCGVFGVSSHEYLNYALANREEWERRGEEIVAAYVKGYNSAQCDEVAYC